jgi:CHAD domain-containing protein
MAFDEPLRTKWSERHTGVGPALVGAVQLPATLSAAEHCSVLLAFHAEAISQNLHCVFTSIDPEGPHQLRVALRRLRVILRVFEPVMRRSAVASLRIEARRFGTIVSELRDADVMIDEIIGPELRERQSVLAALNAWRQEVRGRVRARLMAVGAEAFARNLAAAAATYDWRKKRRDAQAAAATALMDDFLSESWAHVAPVVPTLMMCPPEQIHDLRKEVKALRYAAEMGGALAREDCRKLAKAFKRVQDALGYVNDVETLKRFAPALAAEGKAVSALCARLAHERAAGVHANRAIAQAVLREIGESHAFAPRAPVA